MTLSKNGLQQFKMESWQPIKILKDKKKKNKKKKTFSVFASYGELFLKQGRPGFCLKGCAILCITTYKVIKSGEELRIRTVARSFPHPSGLEHAESLVFNEINLTEKKDNCKAVRVELFSSYSPCIKCCQLIEQFLHRRPQCKISITFTCVYLDYDQQHRSALSGLWKNPSIIRLDVFGEEEWKVLQDMKLVALTPQQYILMQHWDEYWRNILDDILGWSIMAEKLWVEELAFGSQWEVFQCDCVEFKTDEVQALQKSISAYKKAKLEEMDKKVREAIRKRNREDRILFVALVCVVPFALGFLIKKLIF